MLTQTGAGTPMGELLRRYWWPIAGASEFAEPGIRPVRLLGEDLVLYKDLGGRFGLLDRHCRHRRADLSYGYVEECGLRCNYHGWLYDADGACLAQPYEDMAHPERRLRDEIRIKAYPVEELGGLLWAYLGPEPRPLVPDWEFFSWPNGFRQIVLAEIPCNWFQCQENSIDPVHFEWTHSNWSIRLDGRTGPYTPRHLKVDFSEFEYGFQYKRIREDTDENDRLWQVGRVCLWPCGLFTGNHVEFRVPVDDENTLSVMWHFSRVPHEREPYVQNSIPTWKGPIEDPADRPLDHQPCDEPGFRDLGRAGPHRRPLEGVPRSLRPRHRHAAPPLPERHRGGEGGQGPQGHHPRPRDQPRDPVAGRRARELHRGLPARAVSARPVQPPQPAGLHLPDRAAGRGARGVSRRDGVYRSGIAARRQARSTRWRRPPAATATR